MPSLPHNVQGLGREHVVAVDAPDHECPSSFSLTHRSRLLVKVIDEAHPRIAQRQFLMQGVQLRIGPQPGLPRNPLPLQGRQGEPRKQPPPVLLESCAAINAPGSIRNVPSNAQNVLRIHARILAEETEIRPDHIRYQRRRGPRRRRRARAVSSTSTIAPSRRGSILGSRSPPRVSGPLPPVPTRYSADNGPVKGISVAQGRRLQRSGERRRSVRSSRDTATAARIARIASGSSTVAIKRKRPAQRGPASTSTSNARLIRSAHAQCRELGGADESAVPFAEAPARTGASSGAP